MGHKCCITNVKLVMHIYHCHIRDESFFVGVPHHTAGTLRGSVNPVSA